VLTPPLMTVDVAFKTTFLLPGDGIGGNSTPPLVNASFATFGSGRNAIRPDPFSDRLDATRSFLPSRATFCSLGFLPFPASLWAPVLYCLFLRLNADRAASFLLLGLLRSSDFSCPDAFLVSQKVTVSFFLSVILSPFAARSFFRHQNGGG